MKICPRCKEGKELSLFGSDRSRPDGLSTYCKSCSAAISRARKKTKNVYDREYSRKNRKRLIESTKAWQQKNKTRVQQYQRAYCNKKYERDPYYRDSVNAKKILRGCLKGGDDPRSKALEVLGYTRQRFYDYFKDDIEAFKSTDTPIHIDHKIPWSWFKKGTDIKIICDLRNIRLVVAQENINKMAKHHTPVVPEYLALIKAHVIQPVRYRLY